MQNRTAAARLEAQHDRESLVALIGDLASQSSALVRDEVELAKQEITEGITALKTATVVTVIGAWIMSLALMALTAGAIIYTSSLVGLLNATLIVGGGLLIIATIVLLAGVKRMKAARLKPQQTIETLQEDKEWLKDLA